MRSRGSVIAFGSGQTHVFSCLSESCCHQSERNEFMNLNLCGTFYVNVGMTRDLGAMGLLTQVKKGDDVRTKKGGPRQGGAQA